MILVICFLEKIFLILCKFIIKREKSADNMLTTFFLKNFNTGAMFKCLYECMNIYLLQLRLLLGVSHKNLYLT